MDADARELALELKVAELEERLGRLEQAAAASAASQAAAASRAAVSAPNQAAASNASVAPAAPSTPAAPVSPALSTSTGEPEWLRATRDRAAQAASTYERAIEMSR